VSDARGYLLRQLDTAWKLAQYHLEGLTTEECLWRPADRGLHVWQREDGRWTADWPDREGYDIGPASIAWLSWHMLFWWSMLLDHSFRAGALKREDVRWPGGAEAVRRQLRQLHGEWTGELGKLADEDLRAGARTRWPFQHRPFGDAVAWANVELVKNASEIGYARFLYAGRRG
jgi:DinB superfamily